MPSTAAPDQFSIPAADLALALDRFGDGIEVLSLDCFDTVMWRSLYAPMDLFTELGEITIRQRLYAEDRARARRLVTRGGPEVTLQDIYHQAAPGASDSELNAYSTSELAAEKKRLFPFAPALGLIEAAQRKGIKVIIVSDTYLSVAQLRDLLNHVLGERVSSMISEIFVSCDFGVPKSKGMFSHVLERLTTPPNKILHLGDNYQADFEGARRFGINAVHLEQFTPAIEEQLRLEATTAGFFDSRVRFELPTRQVHRAQLACAAPTLDHSAQRLGYNVVGPIIDGFGRWVQSIVLALRSNGKTVKPLFLLRDGHLPELAYRALTGEHAGRIELSRFAGFASSFVDEASIVDYLQEFAGTRRYEAVAKQLLLTPEETSQAIAATAGSSNPVTAFCRHVLQPVLIARIVERSGQYAQRMLAHVKSESGCEPGDVLLLVDLGYAGTVQDRVSKVLKQALGVEVIGAYLLLRDMPRWKTDKTAMIGADQYDHRVMDSLAAYIALLEQICTVEQASVVDYTDSGTPIRKASDIKGRQSKVRELAQDGCLRYINERIENLRELPNQPSDLPGTLQTAFGSLSRLMFLPSSDELALIDGFEHDVNLGVEDKVQMFDHKAARQGLLQRGLFYTNDNPRQYLPAEIRPEGLSTSLLLMAQRRHGFDLRAADFSHSSVEVPILVANSSSASRAKATASPTHDGFWRLSIPVGKNEFAIGIHFGAIWNLIQLHSVTTAKAAVFMQDGEHKFMSDARSRVVFEAVKELTTDVLQFESAESFMFVAPGPQAEVEQLLHFIFRPLTAVLPTAQPISQVPLAEEVIQ